MAQVFISYDYSDKSLANELADELTKRNHNVIYTDAALTPGLDWRAAIQKHLSSSDVTLVLLTQNSVKSEWVIAEASAAMAYTIERGKGSVIPIVFDQIDIPHTLQSIQAIFAYDRDMSSIAEEVDKAINALLGRQIAKEEKQREERAKIEKTAADFIKASQDTLKSREDRYRRQAYFWYIAALVALIGGVVASIWRASLIHNQLSNWIAVAELGIIGIFLIGLIIAIAKYAFTLGKSFMVEALRNADRSHAIAFGEFYLNAFGDNLEWKELKEAFQHWNIDKGSTFLTQETNNFDPKLLEQALELAKIIASVKEKEKEKK